MVSLVEFRRMPKPGRAETCWGDVGQMFVREELRGHEIGTRLLSTLIETADSRGYVRIVLSPSPRAMPFFRRAGFASTDGSSAAPLLMRELAPGWVRRHALSEPERGGRM